MPKSRKRGECDRKGLLHNWLRLFRDQHSQRGGRLGRWTWVIDLKHICILEEDAQNSGRKRVYDRKRLIIKHNWSPIHGGHASSPRNSQWKAKLQNPPPSRISMWGQAQLKIISAQLSTIMRHDWFQVVGHKKWQWGLAYLRPSPLSYVEVKGTTIENSWSTIDKAADKRASGKTILKKQFLHEISESEMN